MSSAAVAAVATPTLPSTDGASKPLSKKAQKRLQKKAAKKKRKEAEAAARRARTAARQKERAAAPSLKSTPLVLPEEPLAGAASSGPDVLHSDPRESVGPTPALEIEHVQRVYDSVATQWHGTRYKSWPRVEAFVLSHAPGAVLGDFGCGNGKNLPACAAAGGMGIGCDFSIELAKIVASRGFEILAADVTALPFRDNAFDGGLCIAVLHHISSRARRVRLLRECMRCVRIGGRVLFYAWAFEQKAPASVVAQSQSPSPPPVPEAATATGAAAKEGDVAGGAGKATIKNPSGVSGHRFATQDVLVPYHVKKNTKAKKKKPQQQQQQKNDRSAETAEAGTAGDADAATSTTSPTAAAAAAAAAAAEHGEWDKKKDAMVYQRYCHVYAQGELQGLFEALKPWVEVDMSYWDTGNWAVVARKVAAEPKGRQAAAAAAAATASRGGDKGGGDDVLAAKDAGPMTSIPLASDEGQRLLAARAHPLPFERLWPHFRAQETRTTCCVASLAMICNALAHPHPHPHLHSQFAAAGACTGTGRGTGSHIAWDEDAVLRCIERSGTVAAAAIARKVKVMGCTLEEAHKFALALGLRSILRRVEARADGAADGSRLRMGLREATEAGGFVLLNYHMTTAGQPPFGGHFSPLVAEAEKVGADDGGNRSGRQQYFGVLDVWPETGPCFLFADALEKATAHVDDESGLPRGFLVLSSPQEEEEEVHQQNERSIAATSESE